jgi:hypothetical protein
MEERLFLDRVARQDANVAEGYFENAVVVEADAANAVAAGFDQAAMPAGETADGVLGLVLNQRLGGWGNVPMQHVLQGFEAGLIVEDFEGGHGLGSAGRFYVGEGS